MLRYWFLIGIRWSASIRSVFARLSLLNFNSNNKRIKTKRKKKLPDTHSHHCNLVWRLSIRTFGNQREMKQRKKTLEKQRKEYGRSCGNKKEMKMREDNKIESNQWNALIPPNYIPNTFSVSFCLFSIIHFDVSHCHWIGCSYAFYNFLFLKCLFALFSFILILKSKSYFVWFYVRN